MSQVFAYRGKIIGGGSGSGGTTYTAGDNISISAEDVISSDQTQQMTYDEFDELTPAEKIKNKIRFLTEAPELLNVWFDANTNTIKFAEGFASYDDETKTIKIGG